MYGRRAASSANGLRVAVVVLMAVALAFAIATFAASVWWPTRGVLLSELKPQGVDFSPLAVLDNAVYQFDQTSLSVPPDTSLAVGPDRIVAADNAQMAVFDKQTLGRVTHAPSDGALFVPPQPDGGDVHVIYDPHSQRFFFEYWNFYMLGATLTWNGTTENVPVAGYSQKGFAPVTAQLVVADPPTVSVNGVPTLNNAAACAGKIVIVYQGGNVLSYDKALKVIAAGGVGMIFIPLGSVGFGNVPNDNRPDLPLPVIGIQRPYGLQLAAHLGQATIGSLVPKVAYNIFGIAVSTSSSPTSAADWTGFLFDASPAFPDTQLDFPKLGADESSLYLSIQAFNTSLPNNISNYAAITFQFTKSALLTGVGGPIAPHRTYKTYNQTFLFPAAVQPPYANQLFPTFFVGTDCDPFANNCASTAFRIYASVQPYQGLPAFSEYVTVPFPTPMQFADSTQSHNAAPQPPPENVVECICDGGLVFSPIVRGNRMWVVLGHSQGSIGCTARWFEFDLSRYLSHNDISLVQWGDLSHVDGASTCFGAINVDVRGNMAVAFMMTSATQAPTLAYTGRLASDPPGTVRVPYQTPLPSEYSYSIGGGFVNPFNRYGDYSGLCVDPSDGETFYAAVEHPSQLSSDNDGQTTTAWTVPIVKFNLVRKVVDGGPRPALGPRVVFDDSEPDGDAAPDSEPVLIV